MIQMWDLAIRLYHWLQALIVLLLLVTGFTGTGASLLHIGAGLMLLLLLIWRVIWGITGSDTARFANFVPSPRTLLAYLRGRAVDYIGHNPAGALMVVTMISILLLQTMTGLVLSGLIDSTVLFGRITVRLLEQLHAMNAQVLTGMIILHIVAVACHGWLGRPLLRAMITGKMPGQCYQPALATHTDAVFALLKSLAVMSVVLSGAIFLDI